MKSSIFLVSLIVLIITFSGCIDDVPTKDCASMESGGIFGSDGCWLDVAEDNGDLSLCDNIQPRYDDLQAACVGRVAAVTNAGSGLCAKRYPFVKEKPGYHDPINDLREYCERIYAEKTSDRRVEECKKLGGEKTEFCLMSLAVELQNPVICYNVNEKNACYTMVAIEKKSPKDINSLIPLQERDKWLALYFSQTFDESVLEEIKEAKYYNYAFISAIITAYGQYDKTPELYYCDILRTDYTYEGTGQTEEEMYNSDKNQCEMMVAAVNEINGAQSEACDNFLQGRIIASEENKKEYVSYCKNIVSKLQNLHPVLADATPGEISNIMNDLSIN